VLVCQVRECWSAGVLVCQVLVCCRRRALKVATYD
jgi:hypothetical protein